MEEQHECPTPPPSKPNLWPPFNQRLLDDAPDGTQGSKPTEKDLTCLMSASRRTEKDDLVTPPISPVLNITGVQVDQTQIHVAAIHKWVDEETDLHRLADIHDWLWIVGRPMPPRPLHHQRLLNREIMITEKLDLHLVWTGNRIFIKPLPRYLLEPLFWASFLSCDAMHGCNEDKCSSCGRRQRALGFLFSYASLIMYESDFHMAKETHLIPEEVQWSAWRAAVRELLASRIYPRIHPRFQYGELRLSRLNKIYLLWKTPLRGYMSRWNQYSSFFGENFALLASSTVYIIVVLTAMQVGLATLDEGESDMFRSVSFNFAIFAIIAPLAGTAVVLTAFFYLFLSNWVATRLYRRKRLDWMKTR